jgi:membrane protein
LAQVPALVQAGSARPDRLVVVLRWCWVFYRELSRDRAFARAAGMSYTTLVALVPLLVIVLGVLSATGSMGEDPETTAALLVDRFLGEVPGISDLLIHGVLQVDLKSLGAVALCGLLIVAARLYLTVERAYNDFFGVVVRRNLAWRLLNFYFAVTAFPVLAVVLLRGSIRLTGELAASWPGQVVLVGFEYGMLLLALKLFPSCRVQWSAAASGALASTLLIEAGRRLFGFYVAMITAASDPLTAVYGSIGLVPVFLTWIYLLWLFVLVGVEVANALQNYSSLLEAELEVGADAHHYPSLDTALQVLTWISWQFERCGGPISWKELGARTGLPARAIRQTLEVLDELGLVVAGEGGFVPARAPDQVPLADVAQRWRAATVPGAAGADGVRAEIDARLAVEGTLADAVARWIPGNTEPCAPRGRT